MSAKGVFASQTFAIYITGYELDRWTNVGTLEIDVYIGQQKVGEAELAMGSGGKVSELLRNAYLAERIAIDTARSKMLPRSDTRSADRQRRKVESRD